MSTLPVLYSFRRCPYAMRARMALWISGAQVELREVKLADKPDAMLEASPKGTVPVLLTPQGNVVDESLAIMRHALALNDPEGWLERDDPALLEVIDGPFKHHLDRYKYFTRYGTDPEEHRGKAAAILLALDAQLESKANLCGEQRGLADIATFPFIRQFANHDRSWFDRQAMPHLRHWLARHLESALFAAIMPKFQPWKPGQETVHFGS